VVSTYTSTDQNAPRWPLPTWLTGLLVTDPIAWLEREKAVLVTGVRQAARAEMVELCWSLAATAEHFLECRSYLDDWQDCTETALARGQPGGKRPWSGEHAVVPREHRRGARPAATASAQAIALRATDSPAAVMEI
jgi:hypothetical protein